MDLYCNELSEMLPSSTLSPILLFKQILRRKDKILQVVTAQIPSHSDFFSTENSFSRKALKSSALMKVTDKLSLIWENK